MIINVIFWFRSFLCILVFTLLIPILAWAVCPAPSTFYDGFSGQFFASPFYTPKTIGFIFGLDEQTLYVQFYNGSMTTFYPVPQSTVAAFNHCLNPDIFYTTQILPIYPETAICGSPPLG